jgi:putative acetyltransferase
MAELRFQFRDADAGDEAAIRALVNAVREEYGVAAGPDSSADADLAAVTASYAARGGLFRVLVSADGRIVGVGGLYPLSDDEAEIRKMYLAPEARGRGKGRQLLDDLIEGARRRAFKRVVLETASVLTEAISLFRSFGFAPIARSHLTDRCDLALALQLSSAPVAPTLGLPPTG